VGTPGLGQVYDRENRATAMVFTNTARHVLGTIKLAVFGVRVANTITIRGISMKRLFCLLGLLLSSLATNGEELSDMPDHEIDRRLFSNKAIVPLLVQHATVAGVGKFTGDCANTNVAFVDIAVDQWWTTGIETNVVRFYRFAGTADEHWVFPTNIPVVFFGISKAQLYGKDSEQILAASGERGDDITFSDLHRSWFRVSRDNGLLHSFATNLWDCVRTNPDGTRYYNILRDADREITRETSWRIKLDALSGLAHLFETGTEALLSEKIHDQLLRPTMRNYIGNTLMNRFDWQVKVIDGVPQWAPPD